jgi:hypothetical protein
MSFGVYFLKKCFTVMKVTINRYFILTLHSQQNFLIFLFRESCHKLQILVCQNTGVLIFSRQIVTVKMKLFGRCFNVTISISFLSWLSKFEKRQWGFNSLHLHLLRTFHQDYRWPFHLSSDNSALDVCGISCCLRIRALSAHRLLTTAVF